MPSARTRLLRSASWLVLVPAAFAQAPVETVSDAELACRTAAGRVIDAVVTENRERSTEAREAHLRAALPRLAEAARLLPKSSRARSRFDALTQVPDPAGIATDGSDWRRLLGELEDLRDDLAFRPTLEAPLPKGFPGFRAVDEVEWREYPAYRLARAPMRGAVSVPFWALFQHIQKNDIAMTAPVQMDYPKEAFTDPERDRESSMAFLYGDPETGKAGKAGRVEVVDVPATTVLSIGARGYESPQRVRELRERLASWLSANAPDWEAAGPQRVMSYNSPSVGGDRRYFEVQIPLQPRTAKAASRRTF